MRRTTKKLTQACSYFHELGVLETVSDKVQTTETRRSTSASTCRAALRN